MLKPVLKREGEGSDSGWKSQWQCTFCYKNKITFFYACSLLLSQCEYMQKDRNFAMNLWLRVWTTGSAW